MKIPEPAGGHHVDPGAAATAAGGVRRIGAAGLLRGRIRDDGAVYHTYSTTWRGLEFVMGYYPILDHAPKGRDEGEAWQLWIRRHDEYESE